MCAMATMCLAIWVGAGSNGLKLLDLFAGTGGLARAARELGWDTEEWEILKDLCFVKPSLPHPLSDSRRLSKSCLGMMYTSAAHGCLAGPIMRLGQSHQRGGAAATDSSAGVYLGAHGSSVHVLLPVVSSDVPLLQ